MRAVVVGAGAVGARSARQLMSLGSVQSVAVVEPDEDRRRAVVASLGSIASEATTDLDTALAGAGVVVVAVPGRHRPIAEAALAHGAHVVSVADALTDVEELLDLDGEARKGGVHLVVGAGFSPGLSCVLAAHAARSFEQVEEIHVARVGTGGPACARQHHRALRGPGVDWHDGTWEKRSGGSGRQLCWFPDPVRGVDCYRAALGEPLLLAPAFPGVARVTARVGASRRDRLSSRLPMLRRPHPEGGLAAIRVEVRGTQGSVGDDRVLGAVDRPAVAAGVVSALAGWWALEGRLARTGAAGLAELVEPGPFLAALAERGVKVAIFEGARSAPAG